jgi:hypothetical protein
MLQLPALKMIRLFRSTFSPLFLSLCLILFPFHWTYGANEFESFFIEKLPELAKQYVFIGERRQELIALKMQLNDACVKYEKAQKKYLELSLHSLAALDLASTRQESPKVIDAATAARNESEQAYGITEELNITVNQKHIVYDRLDHEYRKSCILPLVNQYAWAIPNDAAITTMRKYGPIIEVGAGSGYWAQLLKASGVDIVAYDDGSWQKMGLHDFKKLWFPELREEISEHVVNTIAHTDRTLFICWPPKSDFAFNVLKNYPGSLFIYIGELPDELPFCPATANARFFDYLESDFEIIEELNLPHWPGFSDRLYVFRRKSTRDGK